MACGAFSLQHACICTVLQQHVLCVCVCVVSGHTLPYICERVCVCVCMHASVNVCLLPLLSSAEAVLALLLCGMTLFLEAHGECGLKVIRCFSAEEVQKKKPRLIRTSLRTSS